jgi:hypothetical protein
VTVGGNGPPLVAVAAQHTYTLDEKRGARKENALEKGERERERERQRARRSGRARAAGHSLRLLREVSPWLLSKADML